VGTAVIIADEIDPLETAMFNSYAALFNYEFFIIEQVASAECEAITTGLAAWVNEAFNPA
jgi:hypothetical protein